MLMFGPIVIGALIGLVLGMLGGGGAILAVPALVYLLGASPHAAIAASLAVVAVGALTGLAGHARAQRVAWGAAIRLGLSGVVGSMVGAWLGHLIPGERLLALLGLFMLLAAWLMIRRPSREAARPATSGWKLLGIGVALGLLTGFFGVGGGFLIVPALTLGVGLPIRLAVGTSLAVISANSVGGVVGYLGAGEIDWSLTLLVSLGAVAGALVGTRLAGIVPERGLRRGFAGLVALTAMYLVYRNATAWVSAPAVALLIGS